MITDRHNQLAPCLHVGRDDVVVVHHGRRVDKLADRLGFGVFGSLGLGFRYSLAKFQGCHGLELGCFVTKLAVGLLKALDISANHTVLIIFAIEVDEDDEENEENDKTDAGDNS